MRLLLGSRQFLALLFAALAIVPAVANPYILYVCNLGMLYIILALGLNILVGYAGQFALANAAMFGIGAYGAGLLQVKLGAPFFLAAPGGAILAMLIGTVIVFPALRLSGIYLGLSTLAFAMFSQWVLLHWNSVTFGGGGFPAPHLDLSPLPIGPDLGIYFLSWIVTIALVAFAWSLVRSRVGRAFVAVRDGEIAAQSLGIDLLRYKALAFAISGFYAGTAGALYAPLLGYVSPEGFDLFQMIIQKSMIVVGGMGSVLGSVLGAAVMVTLLELLRAFKSTQEIVFGSILIVFVMFRPRGLVTLLQLLPGWEEPLSSFDPGRLFARAAIAAGSDPGPDPLGPSPELADEGRR
ncbi:MAG: branched-chain amino acid ABC transporter permease [Acidobacteriota bacterium]